VAAVSASPPNGAVGYLSKLIALSKRKSFTIAKISQKGGGLQAANLCPGSNTPRTTHRWKGRRSELTSNHSPPLSIGSARLKSNNLTTATRQTLKSGSGADTLYSTPNPPVFLKNKRVRSFFTYKICYCSPYPKLSSTRIRDGSENRQN
jgi:hypothetical protein